MYVEFLKGREWRRIHFNDDKELYKILKRFHITNYRLIDEEPQEPLITSPQNKE